MNIRVVSLNCWYGRQQDKLWDFLVDIDADIYLLQEVTRGYNGGISQGIGNLFEQLNTKLPGAGWFHPVISKQNKGPSYQWGLACFTRLPVKSVYSEYYFGKLLEVEKIYKGIVIPGCLQKLEISLASSVKINLVNTHFLWSMFPEITDTQLKAADALQKKLSPWDNIIIGGDFNVTADSKVGAIVFEGFTHDRPQDTVTTLDSKLHSVKGSIDVAVDFVSHTGNLIQRKNSFVPELGVSDHLPIVVDYQVLVG